MLQLTLNLDQPDARSEPLIGCAGWSIPREANADFPHAGSHLERYASRFGAVEINTSFYRPHQSATYRRWAASVPTNFRFAVKVPKRITHQLRLKHTDEALSVFLAAVEHLESKLGCLLVQLPPSFAFDEAVAQSFFTALRSRFAGGVACEPRHPSWFADPAESLLTMLHIARVAADPAPVPAAAKPGGWAGLVYRRLHGSPKMYYSAYAEEYLDALAAQLTVQTASDRMNWCIFDNTAEGAAIVNALALRARCAGATQR